MKEGLIKGKSFRWIYNLEEIQIRETDGPEHRIGKNRVHKYLRARERSRSMDSRSPREIYNRKRDRNDRRESGDRRNRRNYRNDSR